MRQNGEANTALQDRDDEIPYLTLSTDRGAIKAPVEDLYAAFLKEELPNIVRGLVEQIVRTEVVQLSQRIQHKVVGVVEDAQKIAHSRFKKAAEREREPEPEGEMPPEDAVKTGTDDRSLSPARLSPTSGPGEPGSSSSGFVKLGKSSGTSSTSLESTHITGIKGTGLSTGDIPLSSGDESRPIPFYPQEATEDPNNEIYLPLPEVASSLDPAAIALNSIRIDETPVAELMEQAQALPKVPDPPDLADFSFDNNEASPPFLLDFVPEIDGDWARFFLLPVETTDEIPSG